MIPLVSLLRQKWVATPSRFGAREFSSLGSCAVGNLDGVSPL